MEVEYTAGFTRDLRQIRSSDTRQRVLSKIEQIEESSAITQVTHVVRMTGASNYYRVRIGDYRLGITVQGNVVILHRFLHRRDIYRYFP